MPRAMDSPLNRWLQSKNISQADLGNAVGISRASVGFAASGSMPLTGELLEYLVAHAPEVVEPQQRFYEDRKRNAQQVIEEAA